MNDTNYRRKASPGANDLEATGAIVIATGCPHSGWDIALPALQQTALQPAGEGFSRWHDELFDAADTPDVLTLRQSLRPDGHMADRASKSIPALPSEKLLLADGRCLWLLDFWAATLPHARFLLFYTSAEIAIARMLLNGVNTTDLFEIWEACNTHLMYFQRRHRHRAILFDAKAASKFQFRMIDACQKIGITLDAPQEWSTPLDEFPELERMAAGILAAAASPAVQALSAELEASAQPLGDTAPPLQLQPEQILEIYLRHKRSAQKLQRKLGEVKEKLTLSEDMQKKQTVLLDTQKKIANERQTEIERRGAERQQMQRRIEEAKQSSRALKTEKTKIEQENELLLLQLHQVQEELEHYFLKYQELNRRFLTHEEESRKLRPQLVKLATTLACTISKPFHAIEGFNRKKVETILQTRFLNASGLFDEAWYLANNPDVASAGIDPIKHYLNHGAAEGRNPSASFNTLRYLNSNPDVAASGMNPLIHFAKFGKAEGRNTS